MIVVIHSAGKSFKGLATYLTHDPEAKTEERVAWTHTLNLAHDDVPSAVDEMLWTARSAELLKQEAGLRGGGRATENATKHVSLSWARDETPTREHILETADKFLQHMKWHEHQAVLVAHDDKEHAHVHMMINTVHPDTGLHLDDNFDKRRAQKWALGYEQENGAVHCPQRLKDMAEREEAPTRPAWTAFKDKEKEFVRDENALAAQLPTPINENEKENADIIKSGEKKLLKQFQRQERMDFFAEGKSEFTELRRAITREVRDEFRDRWADYYASAKSGADKESSAATKAQLVADQKVELEARRDAGCEKLRETRDAQYRMLLDYQFDLRHALSARHELGHDNGLFFQLLGEGKLRDRWDAFNPSLSDVSVMEDAKLTPVGAAKEKAENEEERPLSDAPSKSGERDGPSVASGIDKGAAIGSDLGLGFIFFFDKLVGGATSANSNARPQHTQAPAHNLFDGIIDEARKRQQAEREVADEEWRKNQRSYGE